MRTIKLLSFLLFAFCIVGRSCGTGPNIQRVTQWLPGALEEGREYRRFQDSYNQQIEELENKRESGEISFRDYLRQRKPLDREVVARTIQVLNNLASERSKEATRRKIKVAKGKFKALYKEDYDQASASSSSRN